MAQVLVHPGVQGVDASTQIRAQRVDPSTQGVDPAPQVRLARRRSLRRDARRGSRSSRRGACRDRRSSSRGPRSSRRYACQGPRSSRRDACRGPRSSRRGACRGRRPSTEEEKPEDHQRAHPIAVSRTVARRSEGVMGPPYRCWWRAGQGEARPHRSASARGPTSPRRSGRPRLRRLRRPQEHGGGDRRQVRHAGIDDPSVHPSGRARQGRFRAGPGTANGDPVCPGPATCEVFVRRNAPERPSCVGLFRK